MRRRLGRSARRCAVTGKVRYRSEDDARTVINRARPHDQHGGAVPIRAYRCPHCAGFHTTSKEYRP